MKLPDKWTKLQLEAFHNNDAISVAIKLHQLIDYLAEREAEEVQICRGYTKIGDEIIKESTPLFKAEDVPEAQDIEWFGRRIFLLQFPTKEAAEQAREALLKLIK